MPRYTLNTYSDPDRPRMPWWGWVLLVLALAGVGAVGQHCQGPTPAETSAGTRPR